MVFSFQIVMIMLFLHFCKNSSNINLSNYDYPNPEKGIKELFEYTIAIIGTNDIHGESLPISLTNPKTKEEYNYGGLAYLSSYIKALQKQWGNRILWLDSGDQFQGTVENYISKGSLLTDFFNVAKVDGSTIGNHEWDFGREWLNNRLRDANWQYNVANLYNNKTNQPEELINSVTQKLFNVGKIKIGVIGITTIETPFTTAGDITNLVFKNYEDIIIDKSKFLRAQGANAIMLNCHVGLYCPGELEAKSILRMRNEREIQGKCNSEDELYKLLHNLPQGTIDGVVSGHTHDIVHHWINGVPVIQNAIGGKTFNILYFTFDNDFKIKRDVTKIEGPMPVCERILGTTLNCNPLNINDKKGESEFHRYYFHENLIVADQEIIEKYKKWEVEIDKYTTIIGQANTNIIKDYTKESTLGNMVTDFIKDSMKADVAIINNGAFRSSWFIGPITVGNLFNMFPFVNTFLVSFEMKGFELKNCLKTLQEGSKGLYATSGVVQDIVQKPKRVLLNVRLTNDIPIDDNATYKIVTVEFLLNGGDDFKDVRKWYTPRNVIKDSRELRDVIKDYILKIKEINDGDFIDINKPRYKFLDSK